MTVFGDRKRDDVENSLRERMHSGAVHFMGIGGAGMCALAEALARAGARVSGCDMAPGSTVHALEGMGIRILEGHDPGHLDGVDLVVTTAAIPAEHPELEEAGRRGIPVVKRARALGAWVNGGEVVAVSGTHGKTTTTAMTTAIFIEAGRDPTGFVGGRVPAWAGNLRPGADRVFVVEADEYDRSFHHLRPTVAVVTNMEADHLDIYGDLAGVKAGFLTFLSGVREGGAVLVCGDDSGAASLLTSVSDRGQSYGFSAGCGLRGTSLEATVSSTRFRVWEGGADRGWLEVSIPGTHNALNALAAAGAARAMGVDWVPIRTALSRFAGVERRFHRLGRVRGVTVVDDYAHHPTELEAAIRAGRQFYPGERLVAVFQPHLYTRTRDFVEEFARVLATADVVWVTDIYPAREPAIPGVDAAFLVERIAEAGRSGSPLREVRVAPELAELPRVLADELCPGDLCLLLGAGSIESVGGRLIHALEDEEPGPSAGVNAHG